MELTVKGNPKEIAALVVALQERQDKRCVEKPLGAIQEAVQSAIGGTAVEKQSS